jgi:hypothetical protein
MDDPRESKATPATSNEALPPQSATKDDADAAIAWYMSDEFEEHVGTCFEEGKRKALDARDAFLKERQAKAAHESNP